MGLLRCVCIRGGEWLVGSRLNAVGVVDAEGVQDGFPPLYAPGRVPPAFLPFDGCEVEDFKRSLLCREMPAPHCCVAEPRVQALDRVC